MIRIVRGRRALDDNRRENLLASGYDGYEVRLQPILYGIPSCSFVLRYSLEDDPTTYIHTLQTYPRARIVADPTLQELTIPCL